METPSIKPIAPEKVIHGQQQQQRLASFGPRAKTRGADHRFMKQYFSRVTHI